MSDAAVPARGCGAAGPLVLPAGLNPQPKGLPCCETLSFVWNKGFLKASVKILVSIK